ncbi:MAG: YncE family protein [Myxococcota bacterium]|nr:YncE family protein [Myxococcota bacterium]
MRFAVPALVFSILLGACAARPATDSPPPSEATPPPPTLLQVRVEPADALLTVDDRAIDAGVDFTIAAGAHTLRAERKGFEGIEREVQVAEGKSEQVTLQLVGLPQQVTVVSYPPGAAFTIRQGEETVAEGPAPLSAEVLAGSVQVSGSLEGYADSEATLFIDETTTHEECMDRPGQLLDCLWEAPSVRSPKAVAFAPDSKEVWTAQLNKTPSLRVYDIATGVEKQALTLGKAGAVELLFSEDGALLYASQMDTGTVWEIDPKKREILRKFKTKSRWTKIVERSFDGKRLYASNWLGHDVSEIDIEAGKTLRRLKTVNTPRGLWAAPDGERLFVAGFGTGQLHRIDLATGKGKVIFKGGVLRHLEPDEQRGRLYISDMRRSIIWVMDMATEKVTKLASVEKLPNTIALTPDGKVLFVSCRGRNHPKNWMQPGPEWGSIMVLDALSGEVLDVIVAGNQPTGLDVSPDGRFMAFSDILDNRIRLYRVPPYEELLAGSGGLRDSYKKALKKR